MTRKLSPVLMIFLLVPLCVQAQSWLGIVPAGSAVDWSQAGIPGGIPTTRTQCGSTLVPSGASDVAQIQNALNACATAHPLSANSPDDGGYVLLGSGTFQIDGVLTMKNNVSLRGGGPRKTILNNTITSGNTLPIRFGSSAPSGSTYTTITGGATQGSTSITVSGGTLPTAGQMLLIDEIDPSWVDLGGCTWCSVGMQGTTGQIVEVLTSSSGSVTFRPALYFNYSTHSPRAHPFNFGVKYAGLEYLQIYSNNDTNACGSNGTICGVEYMTGALYSWVRGVEHNFADEGHEQISYSLGVEIRDNFFHDGYYHGSGQNDNQINVSSFSSGVIIENNILYRQHASVMFEWGGGGDVFAYNYMAGNYHDDFPQAPWMIYDTGTHGATPWFILFEGNVGDKFQPDDIHGSSAYLTVFRNYYGGSRLYVPPIDARGALLSTSGTFSACPSGTQSSVCWEDSTASRRAYSIDYVSEFDNLVGDIAGSAHLAAANPGGIVSPPASFGTGVCVSIGFSGGNTSSGSTSGTGCTPSSSGTTCGSPYTTYVHGVYNCASSTFQWTSNVTQTLPPSFYLSSKPAYFGTKPWPLIGPDVSGGNLWSGHANSNPAQDCFNNSAKDANGYPLFDPIACYPSGGSSTGAQPAPPTGLSGVVQ